LDLTGKWSVDEQFPQASESPWRGGAGFLTSIRASFHPASQLQFTASDGKCPYESGGIP